MRQQHLCVIRDGRIRGKCGAESWEWLTLNPGKVTCAACLALDVRWVAHEARTENALVLWPDETDPAPQGPRLTWEEWQYIWRTGRVPSRAAGSPAA